MALPLSLFPGLEGPRRLEGQPSLTPFMKWPGGKSQELPLVAALAPPLDGRLIDPFVGGGSVLFATPVDVPAAVNDACRDLIGVYVAAATGDPAFRAVATALADARDELAEREALIPPLAPHLGELLIQHPGRAPASGTTATS